MNKQLKDLSITELKALVYDCNFERNKQASIIEILEKELADRLQTPNEVVESPKLEDNKEEK